MLRVISPLTGEERATFSEDEVPSSVKALKQCLAKQINIPRFQLRILKDTSILDDAEPLGCEEVQLVLMKFQAPSHIKDRELLWAAAVNNPNHLEDNLNAPRDPNFICSYHGTALYVASQHNSLACAVLLVEAKADLELGHPTMNMTPLFAAAGNGHLDLVRFLVERNASVDNKCRAQGATPLHRAAHKDHPEVVRFLCNLAPTRI